MSNLAEQVFEQATMLQKRYMDGFKAGQRSIVNKELLGACKEARDFLSQHECTEQSSVGVQRKALEQAIARAEA